MKLEEVKTTGDLKAFVAEEIARGEPKLTAKVLEQVEEDPTNVSGAFIVAQVADLGHGGSRSRSGKMLDLCAYGGTWRA